VTESETETETETMTVTVRPSGVERKEGRKERRREAPTNSAPRWDSMRRPLRRLLGKGAIRLHRGMQNETGWMPSLSESTVSVLVFVLVLACVKLI
jgi:hypothetical protein